MLSYGTPHGQSGVRRVVASVDPSAPASALEQRRRVADRVFKGALLFNGALTVFWLAMLVTGTDAVFFGTYAVDRDAIVRVISGVLIFGVFWGGIWYGVKNALLKSVAGFSKRRTSRRVFVTHVRALRRQ